jgi:hypothetical protein
LLILKSAKVAGVSIRQRSDYLAAWAALPPSFALVREAS